MWHNKNVARKKEEKTVAGGARKKTINLLASYIMGLIYYLITLVAVNQVKREHLLAKE